MTWNNIVVTNIICLVLNCSLFQRDDIHIHSIAIDVILVLLFGLFIQILNMCFIFFCLRVFFCCCFVFWAVILFFEGIRSRNSPVTKSFAPLNIACHQSLRNSHLQRQHR